MNGPGLVPLLLPSLSLFSTFLRQSVCFDLALKHAGRRRWRCVRPARRPSAVLGPATLSRRASQETYDVKGSRLTNLRNRVPQERSAGEVACASEDENLFWPGVVASVHGAVARHHPCRGRL